MMSPGSQQPHKPPSPSPSPLSVPQRQPSGEPLFKQAFLLHPIKVFELEAT